MKNQLKKYWNSLIILVIMLLPFSIYAKVPSCIRVGLEGVYKGAYEIKISGETALQLGYTFEEKFYPLATLESLQTKIKPSSGNYYAYNTSYPSFLEAQKAARTYEGAVPTYIAPDVFKLYTKDETADNRVSDGSQILELYNERGELIALADCKATPIAFQGESSTYDFPVTKVGDNRSYRGAIELVKGEKGGLTPVNVIGMEEYLYGVVPCEVVPTWPTEALKAQAVAARSIATFQYSRHIKKGYNVVDTTVTQAYGGVTKETNRTSDAVDQTRGELALYKDKVAETLYYSTSGGYTEDPKYVWGNEIDYLKALPDPYETDPEQKPWTRKITLQEIDKCLANAGVHIGSAKGLKIVSRTPSGRVQELQIIGTEGVHTVKNETARTFFSGTNEGSLKSRMFNFVASDYTNTSIGNVKGQLTDKINIMTQDNMVNKSFVSLYVMSEDELERLSDTIWVQSANEVIKLGGTGEATQGEIVGTSEVIYGDFSVYGKGFGHGVGMSQSGAKGMAEEGFSYEDIMKYYFPGIEIQR